MSTGEAVSTGGAVGTELFWERVHPVTPVVKGWKVVAVLFVVAGQQVGAQSGGTEEIVRRVGPLGVLGVIAVAALIGFIAAGLAWRMTRFALGDEALFLHTGVLFRQQRSARLDRIQAIDVVQPLLARLFGLAELRVEVAGGADSAVRLAFLREPEAQQLRNEILARAAGVRVLRQGGQSAVEGDLTSANGAELDGALHPLPGVTPTPTLTPALTPAAPEREVFVLAPGRLVASLVRSGAVLAALVGVLVVIAVMVATRELAAAIGVFPVAAASVGYLWQRFAGEFGFRAATSPDGIRLRHGLLETRAQTVPPGRVQAVELTQPLLWRGPDWWRVQINVAGYGAQDGSTESVLMPVGDRDEALRALWLVLPDLDAADPRALLDLALSGDGPQGGFVTSPPSARWLDPLAWRRTGYAVTGRAVLVRRGRLVRRLVVVPHERTQSIGLNQGPLQRRLGLATAALHSTPGPVTPLVPHLTSADAGALLAEQAVRARAARSLAGPERWMVTPS